VDEPPGELVPYEVAYSGLVRQRLNALLNRAAERGLGEVALAAVKEIHRRLRIYPQFGQPLLDLVKRPAQLWIGVVPPLVVYHGLDEESRTVLVASPIRPLPRSGLD
jgi:hypothetical protein